MFDRPVGAVIIKDLSDGPEKKKIPNREVV
jgi:hypothetical protein